MKEQEPGKYSPPLLSLSLYMYIHNYSFGTEWVYMYNDSILIHVSLLYCLYCLIRFNVRGLNDEGNVANFVESEQILSIDGAIASFVQVRGLVPVFWDQPGIQTGTNRVRLSRGFHCSHSAFVRYTRRGKGGKSTFVTTFKYICII